MKRIHFIFKKQLNKDFYDKLIDSVLSFSTDYLRQMNNDCEITFNSEKGFYFIIVFDKNISIENVFIFLSELNKRFSVFRVPIKQIKIKTK